MGRELPVPEVLEPIVPGSADIFAAPSDGKVDIWFWALGDMLSLAEATSAALKELGLNSGIVNARFISPLDTSLLEQHANQARMIITLENGILTGGFGEAIESLLYAIDAPCRVLRCGWPREFIPQGKPCELMERFGLTAPAIVKRVTKVLGVELA